VLESYADGALLAPGTGTIPATGAGTRLMWYPAKAAFRVGEINETQWDPTNVGDYSMAFGINTMASGVYFYRIRAEGFQETRKMVLVR